MRTIIKSTTITTAITATATGMVEAAKVLALVTSAFGDPPRETTPTPEEAELSPAGLQKLLAWLSPSFPVGAFSYSHGLEWAVEDGTIANAATLASWLADVLSHGAGRSDAILFAHAWRAATCGDHGHLAAIAELAAALQPSKERALETTAQGRAFLTAVCAAWPNPALAALAALFPPDVVIAYAVAVAIATAAEGVALKPALVAYLGAFAANLISAGVRAIPIGQTDGQRVIAATAPLIETIAGAALATPLDGIGGIAFRADIASMKHETQYTRLFRS
jgi:urease accessory protein